MAMVVDGGEQEDDLVLKRQSLESVAAEFEKRAVQSVVKGDHARALLQYIQASEAYSELLSMRLDNASQTVLRKRFRDALDAAELLKQQAESSKQQARLQQQQSQSQQSQQQQLQQRQYTATVDAPGARPSTSGSGEPTSAEGLMGLALKHAAKAEEAEEAGKPNTALELYEQALNLFRFHFQGDSARSQDRQQAKVTMQVFRHALNRRDMLAYLLTKKAQASPSPQQQQQQQQQQRQSAFDPFKSVRALLAPDSLERSPTRGGNHHSDTSSPIFGYSVQRSASHD